MSVLYFDSCQSSSLALYSSRRQSQTIGVQVNQVLQAAQGVVVVAVVKATCCVLPARHFDSSPLSVPAGRTQRDRGRRNGSAGSGRPWPHRRGRRAGGRAPRRRWNQAASIAAARHRGDAVWRRRASSCPSSRSQRRSLWTTNASESRPEITKRPEASAWWTTRWRYWQAGSGYRQKARRKQEVEAAAAAWRRWYSQCHQTIKEVEEITAKQKRQTTTTELTIVECWIQGEGSAGACEPLLW